MDSRNSFLWRLLLALVVVGVLVAGGLAVYRVGFMQGYAQNAAQVAGQNPAPNPGTQPGAPFYAPYGWYPYWGPHFGFFPFWPLGGLFLFLVFFFFLRMLFWPRPWGYPPHRGERRPEEPQGREANE